MPQAMRSARVFIQTGETKRLVPGWVEAHPGANPEQILASLQGSQTSEFDDYVFFQPSPDPATPEKSVVFVFRGDASAFDRGSEEVRFRLLAANELGSVMEIPAVRFTGMVDRSWQARVETIDVRLSSGAGGAPNGVEEKLVRSLTDRLTQALRGQSFSAPRIRQMAMEITREFDELAWVGLTQISVDLVPNPQDPEGPRVIRVGMTVNAAPRTLSLTGLPTGINRETVTWLEVAMQEVFERHPTVVSRRMGDFETSSSFPLRPRLHNGELSWLYPANVPQFQGNPITDGLVGLVAGKTEDLVPSPRPGDPMPLPGDVMDRFLSWLGERLETEPGSYEVRWSLEGGRAKVAVERRDRPQFILGPSTIEAIRRQTQGRIDLSEEAALLGRGTMAWSARRIHEFTEGLSEKFRRAGYELILEPAALLRPNQEGSVEIHPFFTPLIRPDQIRFEGDTDLEGIGGRSALHALLGDRPMTQRELRDRLLKVEERYHEAGYLIVGENLLSDTELQISILPNSDDSLTVVIPVARGGEVIVSGDVPDPSRRALAEAVRSAQGQPMRADDLRRRLRIGASRLGLAPTGETTAFYRPDGSMDLFLNVEKPQRTFQVGAGANATGPVGVGSITLPNTIPGLTALSASIQAGRDRYGAQLSAKTVPITSSGIYVSGNTGFIASDYVYLHEGGSLAEAGTLKRAGGSFLVHVPLGHGVGSPLEFRIGVDGSVLSRDGRGVDGRDLGSTEYSVGPTAGLGAIYDSALVRDDLVQADLSVGLNNNVTRDTGDVTIGGSLNYALPLSRFFALEAVASAGKRMAAYGGGLSPDRLFGVADIPRIDFGRSLWDQYADDQFWYGGLFLVLTQNRFVQPMVGGTVSSNGRGGAQGGAGLALRVPIVGLTVYLGLNQEGRVTFGLGAAGRWSF